MIKTKTLTKVLQFWIIGKQSDRDKIKNYLNTKRIPYTYLRGVNRFSVPIKYKDQVIAVLKTLKLFIQSSIQKPGKNPNNKLLIIIKMKRNIFTMLCFLIALTLSLTGCGKLCSSSGDTDTSYVEEIPTYDDHTRRMYTVLDAACEHEVVTNWYEVDSTFRSMTEQEVANVSQVLIKQNGFCSVEDIVNEYELHANIYKNLYTHDSRIPLPSDSSESIPNITNTNTDGHGSE